MSRRLKNCLPAPQLANRHQWSGLEREWRKNFLALPSLVRRPFPNPNLNLNPDLSRPMILLHHHVAPTASIPKAEERRPDEGWQFTHSPEAFEFQLMELRRRGYRFVSLDRLVDEIHATGTEP